MKKAVLALVSVSLISTPALGQAVRPLDCRPVFPVVDQVAAVQDVIAEPVAPVATARRGFFGLPLLLPLLAALGGIALLADDDDDDDNPVSPA